MSFTADEQAIRAYAETLGGLTDDADAAVGYAREYLGIGYNEGRMFFTVVETATSVREALESNYQALARLMDQCRTELVSTANMYRDTDQAAAARVDATY